MHFKRKAPLFKYLLSYLFEVKLETVIGEKNDYLEITLNRGRLKLNTYTATYSYEDHYSAFRESFLQIRKELKHIENCLILGYGLGSIPQILQKEYDLTPQIIAVEHDAEIIRLARKHGFTTNVQFMHVDAEDFVPADKGKYDLICIDIFVDNDVPKKFMSNKFLRAIKRRLKPGGLVLFNQIAMNQEYLQSAQNFHDKIFSKIFSPAKQLKTSFNSLSYFKASIKNL